MKGSEIKNKEKRPGNSIESRETSTAGTKVQYLIMVDAQCDHISTVDDQGYGGSTFSE